MNERFNELYKQAHIEHRQEYFSSVVDPTIKSVSVTRQFDPEKFAELIIQECLSIVDDAERGGNNETWDNAVKFIRRDLKEHFGIKDESKD